MVLFKLELLLSTIDKFGILIFSALYRVLCAKNNIDFVLRLLVARVKLIIGALRTVMFVVLNIFEMILYREFEGILTSKVKDGLPVLAHAPL